MWWCRFVASDFCDFLGFCGLLAALFNLFETFSFEILPPACVGDDLFGLADFIGAVVAKLLADFRRKLALAFDGDRAEVPLDFGWAQCVVPIGVHAWCDDLQFVAVEMCAELAPSAAEVWVYGGAEVVNWKRSADLIADVLVSRSADEDSVAGDLVVSDVGGALIDHRVLGGG